MKLLSPGELGFPEKYDAWRPSQIQALEFMSRSQGKRARGLCMPTGSGKTGVYVADAILSGEPTCFVTDSRGLQDQIMRDFEGVGMVDIRGRRNYECGMRNDYTCEDGHAARCPYKGTISCPSSQAEMRASTSTLVVTNYAKWTASRKFGQGMAHFSRVVFDEGHEAPHALAASMQVVLNDREITERLGLTWPPESQHEDFINWKPWASTAKAEAEEQMLSARARIAGESHPKPGWVRDYLHLRNLVKRLSTVSTANPNNWIVDRTDRGYQFDPIRPGRYAEAALLFRVPHITVISATLRPKTLFMIGIGKDSFDFKEFDSDFDPKDCPIYYIPTMRVDSRALDLAPMYIKIDQIAAKRTDRKGIIHTISYARRSDILQASRFSSAMLVNERGEAATDIVEMYKESKPGTILVSPSVGQGYDFPGSDCEWQFVCKIPFPDSRNKIIRARSEDDKEYAPYLAITKLVQIFGRGARFRGDRCENFIVDSHLDWFLPRYGYLAPKSFHNFYKRVSSVPQPPGRL